MRVLTWSFVCRSVPLYDWARVTFFSHSRTRQKHWWFDLYMLKDSFQSSFLWYLEVILTQSECSMFWSCHKVRFFCRSGCFQVRWYFFLCFPLLLISWCTFRVESLIKMQRIRVLSLPLLILSGQGRVLLRGRLSVMPFFCFTPVSSFSYTLKVFKKKNNNEPSRYLLGSFIKTT